MANDNVRLARRWFREVWNQGRTATVHELFAPRGRMHGVGGPNDTVVGPKGFLANHAQLKGAFPDIRFRIHQAIGEGDLVAVRWTATATHQGDHLGPPATGKPVTITGMGFARFRDGKIVEAWNNWDMMGLMHTIGQTPHAKVL